MRLAMNQSNMARLVEIEIRRMRELEQRASLMADLDGIFFEASATRSFESLSAQEAFRERWLGRYLTHDDSWFYVAFAGTRAAGYLAGCLDDPALTGRFKDIWYFAELADLTRSYPAHLHVNLDPEFRSAGVGSRLIEGFAADAAAAGVAGVHVVTGAKSRNRSFYGRNGFVPLRELSRGAQDIVFLGRRLTP